MVGATAVMSCDLTIAPTEEESAAFILVPLQAEDMMPAEEALLLSVERLRFPRRSPCRCRGRRRKTRWLPPA